MKNLMGEHNVLVFTTADLVDALDRGQVQIMCVDGRSVDKGTHQIIINCPGGEFGLYAMLLVALERLAGEDGVNAWHRIVENKVMYAHSDSHVHHHDGQPGDQFLCGCGHIKLMLEHNEYGFQDHIDVLQQLYQQELDILEGDHKEQAIVISKINSQGEFVTIKSNNNQKELGLEQDEQVFIYDEDAIRAVIDYLSDQIISSYDLGVTSDQLAVERKRVMDQHTTLTVQQFLKPAVALVGKGEVYTMIWSGSAPVLTKVG